MKEHYRIAIIGAGPAGLSAAAEAALKERADATATSVKPGHILLEASPAHANTIQRYQKGKHVMDEPGYLDLRSPLQFAAGKRESVLETWAKGIDDIGINIRYNTEVTSISGEQGDFQLSCGDGSTISADFVVLAIGTQGNPRRLGVDGDNSDFVQYQLDDPEAFRDEDIVVVGAGDAAIENALALAQYNRVTIVNRKKEFSRAKPGNLDAVLAAINDRRIAFSCRYESEVKTLSLPRDGQRGSITLSTPHGDETLCCDRVIARLGSIPPRGFLDTCKIQLPNDKPDALPELDRQYQSNIPGLYVVGALAGYPLIKQDMNQGRDVIHFIHGEDVKPVDHPLLALKFALLPYSADVDDILTLYQQRIPMFARLNALAFRELIMESEIIYGVGDVSDYQALEREADTLRAQRIADIEAARERLQQQRRDAGQASQELPPLSPPVVTQLRRDGDALYRDGDYSNSFYTIVEGSVTLTSEDGPSTTLGPGQFFGELSLLSGRPRSGHASLDPDTVLIETPRRTMLKLMASNAEVSEGIEAVFVQRALQQCFAPEVSYSELREIAMSVKNSNYNRGDTIYREGEHDDRLFLIRSGTVALTRSSNGRQLAVGQYHSGQIVGQMALMGDRLRHESAVAAARTELIEIHQATFLALLQKSPSAVTRLQALTASQLRATHDLAAMPENASVISFLLDRGAGEATNVLVIDENLCIGCDNCEIACAETHGGLSRLNRKSGARFANINLPIACRHCEQPHCMKECPPNAIHRQNSGEVTIDDSCIGCGNCETNCPYDVIKMSYPADPKPSLLSWLFTGRGPGPGDDGSGAKASDGDAMKKAVKCDACAGRTSGPACVQSCPTGAAQRIAPPQFVELLGHD
ncbi:cyclic nucleotide-binding domain-containing protein [Spongiibacter nanhainus]|uniref:Cyclic nucleotide-binding domain-containing protein n=1 Tax=Spongiibacter nanhainus TaxID=2794344 RepID=A0A7T4R1E0_9GAMM|nr:cyclic nucleotide-binding domain-containing protein [Spongiibacter nanhainus]QQD18671.1 cyclic nucleotide-binding domain-containing protein [Spongiibacter nanhainus]